MPCFSRITQTQILNGDTLVAALEALKIGVRSKSATRVVTDIGVFERSNATSAFQFEGQSDTTLAQVGKTYARLMAKDYMRRRGLSVKKDEGNRITFTRRG
jgi:hypothetical protein